MKSHDCNSCSYYLEDRCQCTQCPRKFERELQQRDIYWHGISKKCGSRIIHWWRKCRELAKAYSREKDARERAEKDRDCLRAAGAKMYSEIRWHQNRMCKNGADMPVITEGMQEWAAVEHLAVSGVVIKQVNRHDDLAEAYLRVVDFCERQIVGVLAHGQYQVGQDTAHSGVAAVCRGWAREEWESRDAGIGSRPRIVCLCGSTRFFQEFMDANYRLTMQGIIVLSVGFFCHSSNQAHGEGVGITEAQKLELDELHKRKIDLADEVLVLNVGGYIGKSTRSEIEYAERHGKTVRYLT